MIKWIKSLFCKHKYKVYFRAPPQPMQKHIHATAFKCDKCGKVQWRNHG